MLDAYKSNAEPMKKQLESREKEW